MLKISHYYLEAREDKENFINALKKSDSWEIVAKPKQLPKKNIVVVIGESVRKDFLHSYGFPIKNTPFIDNSNRIQFEDYISVATHTVQSLTHTIALSDNLIDYNVANNMISLSKKVGYKTYWISVQGMFGKYSSPISEIGLQANFHYFLPKNKWTHQKDDAMLPHFKKVMKDTAKQKVIVLHMQGSHPLVCDRTGGVYDEFIKSEELSCYNRSIKDLDEFLKNVYTELIKTGEDFDMIYFSDHGLKIKEDGYILHGNAKECYQVPLLLWSNQIKSTKKIKATRTGKDFLYLFSEILGVKTENIQRNYQFVSEDKNDDKEIEVNTEDRKKYKDLESNPVSLIFEEE
ncbi:MAG: phosphoethanolamine transferase [Flavobacteriaceae bacterium]|nr:phosphoethanolamine transferase [Flavobacteriaceae bacterium]